MAGMARSGRVWRVCAGSRPGRLGRCGRSVNPRPGAAWPVGSGVGDGVGVVSQFGARYGADSLGSVQHGRDRCRSVRCGARGCG